MDGVRRYVEREVSANSSRSSIQWVRSPNQGSCDGYNIWTLPHHEEDGAGCHMGDEFLEERLVTVN